MMQCPVLTGQSKRTPAPIYTRARHAKPWGKLTLRTVCLTMELITYFVVRKIPNKSNVRKKERIERWKEEKEEERKRGRKGRGNRIDFTG